MKTNSLKYIALPLIMTAAFATSGCAGPIIAAGVAGAGATSVAGSSLSTGQQIDDQSIKSKINAMLLKLPRQEAVKTNISVTVFNDAVLLLGQVPTEQLKNDIAKATSALPHVKVVYNQLTVDPKQSLGAYLNDGWITTKVKTNMVGHVNPLHFKVVTENRVVYLLGRVSKAAGDEAANVAAHTSGVKQVVKLFNIIPNAEPAPAKTASPQPVQTSNATSYANNTPVNTNLVENDRTQEHQYAHDYQVGSAASD